MQIHQKLSHLINEEIEQSKGKGGWLGIAEKLIANPQVVVKVGELAGIFPKSEENKSLNGTQEEQGEVTFKRKRKKTIDDEEETEHEEEKEEDEMEEITPGQYKILEALQKADGKLKDEDIGRLGQVMHKLTDDPALLIVVNDLIKNSTTEEIADKNY